MWWCAAMCIAFLHQNGLVTASFTPVKGMSGDHAAALAGVGVRVSVHRARREAFFQKQSMMHAIPKAKPCSALPEAHPARVSSEGNMRGDLAP
jgi:hypothetical protein